MPIEVPRHLWYTDALMRPGAGRIVEAGDPEAAVLMAPAGTLYTEEEAKRLGISEYLEAHAEVNAAVEEKAVPQSKVEDKAVAGPAEAKAEDDAPAEPPPEGGVSFPAESRRAGTGRRGS